MGKVSNCSQPKSNRAEEYLIQNWYSGPWAGIFRYNGDKKDTVREAIAQVAIKAATNNKIGYDQSRRITYYNNLKKHNYDPSKITVVCYADCSSSTAANVIAAGHICNVSKLKKVDEGMSTSSAKSVLTKAGFKYYTDNKYRKNDSNLKRGDILFKSGHVCIYVGNGKLNSSKSAAVVTTVNDLDSVPKDFKQNGNKKASGNGATLSVNGCGPTSVADVIAACSRLNPDGKIDQVAVFKWYVKSGLVTGSGSGAEGINKALAHYGIAKKHITKYRGDSWVGHGNYLPEKQATSLINAIKVHHVWAICLTDLYGGHFVVAYTADNKNVKLRDPAGTRYNTISHQAFRNTVRSAWVIDVATYEPNGIAGSANSSINNNFSDTGSAIDLQQAIAQLYTSDNYQWVVSDERKESLLLQHVKSTALETIRHITEGTGNILNDTILKSVIKQQAIEIKQKEIDRLIKKERKLVKGNLASYPNLVEAPFIEVDMNGIIIGEYNHQEDKYPNHINSLEVEKINGRINNYIINITHQIRAGEDPNFIDSLLSRTGVRNKVKIKYGDSAYGAFYREEEAYILDVTYSESVTSSSINYTIKAVSSVGSIQNAYYNFPGVESKPSTQIINMLYNNKYTSNQLLSVLGGMLNKTQVLSSGLIPTDDKSLWIPGGDNMSLVERLNQLVSYMQDPTDPTASYFLTYEDNKHNNSIFKITKVKKTGTSADAIKNCYYLDVGYPGDSFVTSFNIENNIYWPVYFKYAGKFNEYKYDIDYTGKLITTEINPLTISDRYQDVDTRKMNWWNFVSSYPISATVTIKGLMKPVILMENVYVYAQFYGKQDMATGLYSIIGQQDSISGNGYSTTLQLLRVQN